MILIMGACPIDYPVEDFASVSQETQTIVLRDEAAPTGHGRSAPRPALGPTKDSQYLHSSRSPLNDWSLCSQFGSDPARRRKKGPLAMSDSVVMVTLGVLGSTMARLGNLTYLVRVMHLFLLLRVVR